MKRNNDFDRIIREKLEQVQPEFQAEFWDLMEQQLDVEDAGTPEAEEKAIDQSVYAKLHQLQVPYDPETWKILARRIDMEFSFLHRMLRYKAAEIALMALAIFTVLQFLPSPEQPVIGHFPIPGYGQALIPGSDQASPQNGDSQTTTFADNTLQANDDASKPPGEIVDMSDPPENTDATGADQPTSKKQQYSISAADVLKPLHNSRFLERSPPQPFTTLPLISMEVRPLTQEASLSEYLNAIHTHNIDYSLAILDPLSSSHFKTLDPLTNRQLGTAPVTAKRKPNLRFGMLGSVNYDRIITPPTPVGRDTVEGLDRYAMGYGGGITLGFEWGRWELETGVIYTAKQYQALPLVFLDGSFRDGYYGEGFKRIELNIINVPLHLRYNVYHHKRWRFYALAGASLQMAYQTNFYTADQDAFRSLSFNPQPAAPGREPSDSPSGIQEKSRANGLFEGGSFHENSFISANVGLGIERYMSSRISVFAQPTYEHSFYYLNGGRGFGPYADKINSMYLFGGVKIRLFD